MTSEDLNDFVGEDLSGVTFVRDYLQLQFNPPLGINAYSPAIVTLDGVSVRFGEPAFANAIIGQINKVVKNVTLQDKESLDFNFEDGSQISISLRPDDYTGPEAVYVILKNNRWNVI